MLKSPTLRKRTRRTNKRVAMKQTTKPNTKQSHLKRDLARNVAALPLPTPPAGARGEGRWFDDFGKGLQYPSFEEIAARRDEPLSLSIVTTNPRPTIDFRLPNV
jgi:hypothetical protein